MASPLLIHGPTLNLLGGRIPFIEIHPNNMFARETFRHHSYLSDIAAGSLSGFGPFSYLFAHGRRIRRSRINSAVPR
jgi:3-dehydroquinate dehydratase-2